YQVLADSSGAAALTRAWMRSAILRSGAGISAIFASTSPSPSDLSAPEPRRASAFISRTRSFIASFSSSVNPADASPVGFEPFAGRFFSGIGILLSGKRKPRVQRHAGATRSPQLVRGDLELVAVRVGEVQRV